MKTTIFQLGFLCIFLITVCSKCEQVAMDHSYEINIENKADYSIGYYFATGGEYGTYYPDSLPKTNNFVVYDISKVLRPGYESHLEWKKFFHAMPNDTLSVFIFHTDTLNKYSWERIRKDYKILRRYDLSLDDLEKMNWTITYP